MVDFCSSPPIFLVDNRQDILAGHAVVDWSDPIFHDNSLQPLKIDQIGPKGLLNTEGSSIATFAIGETTQVTYIATDTSGNEASCALNITLQGTSSPADKKYGSTLTTN